MQSFSLSYRCATRRAQCRPRARKGSAKLVASRITWARFARFCAPSSPSTRSRVHAVQKIFGASGSSTLTSRHIGKCAIAMPSRRVARARCKNLKRKKPLIHRHLCGASIASKPCARADKISCAPAVRRLSRAPRQALRHRSYAQTQVKSLLFFSCCSKADVSACRFATALH